MDIRTTVSKPPARSNRRLITGLGSALIAAAILAPSATAADNWSGVWHTKHQFGTPRLNLDKQGDRVEGNYRDDHGALRGKIWGHLEGVQNRVWEGHYRDTHPDRSPKGKFRVHLEGDLVHFKGWFKACGRVFCSEKYDWRGDHA
jgi:hypothetical protein